MDDNDRTCFFDDFLVDSLWTNVKSRNRSIYGNIWYLLKLKRHGIPLMIKANKALNSDLAIQLWNYTQFM